jgi:hypothetical protein
VPVAGHGEHHDNSQENREASPGDDFRTAAHRMLY